MVINIFIFISYIKGNNFERKTKLLEENYEDIKNTVFLLWIAFKR